MARVCGKCGTKIGWNDSVSRQDGIECHYRCHPDAISPQSPQEGTRAIVGFAIASGLCFSILGLRLIGIQAMGGTETFIELLLDFGLVGAVAFALLGIGGASIAGFDARTALASLVVFALAGFGGGALLAAFEAVQQPGGRSTNQVLGIVGAIAFVVFPAALGFAWLTRRVARRSRAQDTTA